MNICPTCGAPLDSASSSCPYDVPEEQAPWRADYQAMASGQLTHDEHQVIVARWALHNENTLSEKAGQKMRAVALSNKGRQIKLIEYSDD